MADSKIGWTAIWPTLAAAPGRRLRLAMPRLLFTTAYLVVIAYFHVIDEYDRHFSDAGLGVFVYNCARILFIFYLFWMVEAVGAMTLRVIAGEIIAKVGLLERLTIGFFTGTCIWHLTLLLLGFADLYTVPTAVLITIPLVAASFTDARLTYCSIHSARSRLASSHNRGPGLIAWLLTALVALTLAALLVVKGLYPDGGHDYYTHYFHYFEAVVENHGLWPNNVWYHYYYDKGAGLYFLGILLTDPLAPQLVTFAFFIAATFALYLTLRRIAPGTLWPLVGITQLISIYIFTPGSGYIYLVNGGWGEFEKTHEIIAALTIAVFWMTIEALSSTGKERRFWLIGASATIISAVIVNVTIGAFFGGLFGLLTLYYLIPRRFCQLTACIILGSAAVMSVLATLILNQMTTGLADDQGILLFWRFANIQKLSQWGVLPLVVELVHGRLSMESGSIPLVSKDSAAFLIKSFRLDLVWPMFVGGVVVAIPSLLRRRWNRSTVTPLIVFIAAAATFAIIALAEGRSQQVSFYRYASFATALAIVGGIISWSLTDPEDSSSKFARSRAVALVAMIVCAFAYANPPEMFRTTANAMHFAIGAYSIDTAYQREYGRPDSAMYAGARGAYEAVGPGIPIWALFTHAYCMLPRCLIEEYPGFILARDWYDVMFGTPEQAKAALQASNHNYFLFTREDAITDPLPLSPLFTPDNIGRYLGIRWTDGASSLLTWVGPGIKPLSPAWISVYRNAVKRSSTSSYSYEMKNIFARINATSRPSDLIAPR